MDDRRRTYTGKGVNGETAFGAVFLIRRPKRETGCTAVENVEKELDRLNGARIRASEQLSALREAAQKETGEEDAQIFEVHRMMLEDIEFNESVMKMIREQAVNAEYAVKMTAERIAARLETEGDNYLKERAADVRDVSNRLIACLSDFKYGIQTLTEPAIVCADDLSPGETVLLDKNKVLAFVTERGSVNSHTAILARNRNIPAVVGVGEDFMDNLREGDRLIVDGNSGTVFVNPDPTTKLQMRKKQEAYRGAGILLQELKGLENVTIDGTKVDIFANIGSADEVNDALMNDAGGVGLFRSEFLYLESTDYPDEEEQFESYRRALEGMKGKKVIIRTLDIGADKRIGYFKLDREENPALGLRAVRICLTRPELFRTQLRALYRASIYGNLGILFPMIANVWEVEKILSLCAGVKADLENSKIPYREDVELGIMIETPAAAVISDRLAPMVDFFSVGTNDLMQYTLACDRQNINLEPFCDSHHEAVLRLVEMTVRNAHRYGKRVGICGELAADTSLTETFLRMGIDELSVAAPYILPLRDAVRKIKLK